MIAPARKAPTTSAEIRRQRGVANAPSASPTSWPARQTGSSSGRSGSGLNGERIDACVGLRRVGGPGGMT
jgi:hypothetical protein